MYQSVSTTKGQLVSITDHAGDTILGRHPEHGFVIDGEVRQDVADLLCQRGFQRNTDDLIALPADMPETEARARMVRAAQLLAATRHNVTVLPDDQTAAAARGAEVLDILTTSRDQLLARIRDVHPRPCCLPVPELRTPETRVQFDAEIDAVKASLFTPDGSTHPDWVTAWHVCDHAHRRAGMVAHELVSRWHVLLAACRRYLDDGCATIPDNPTSAAEQLAEGVRTLTVPPRDHAVQPYLVSQLVDEDEFSTDGGTTWHVCEQVRMFTVSVYTGEHDTEGEPLVVRIDIDPNQTCLVRRTLTA